MSLTLEKIDHLAAVLMPQEPRSEAKLEPRIPYDLDVLRRVLVAIPADACRGNGSIFDADGQPVPDYWLGIILAVHREYGDAAKNVARAWSKSSDRFDNDGFEQAWAAFEPEHPQPVTMKSVYRLAETFGWRAEPNASRYTLLNRSAMLALKPLEWRLKGIFPRVGIGAIFGPSGSGKSFLAIDLGIRVAAGIDWYGRKTVPAPVTYVMLEGEAGLRNRIAAWEKFYSTEISSNFAGLPEPFAFSEECDVNDLAAALPRGGVVIIDTLNRAAPGKDENSSKDMGEVLNGTKRLQQLTEGLVLVVHHTGKDVSKGMRGHSSLHAALDGAIEVKRNGLARSWGAAKVKDGDDNIEVPFKLSVVQLGLDGDGEIASSCVATPNLSALLPERRPKGKNQQAAWFALRQMGKNVLSYDDAFNTVACAMTGPISRQKTRTKEALDGLIYNAFLQVAPDNNLVLSSPN